LGATLYHLLSGQPPLPATGRLALQQDPLMSPQHHNPALSPHISAAVMQALQLRVEARYETVLQFKQGLLGARTADGVNLADRAASFTSQPTVMSGQPSSSFADKSTVFGNSQPVSQVVGKRQHDTKPMKRVVSQSPSQSRMMNNAEIDALAVLSNQSVASPTQNITWGWVGAGAVVILLLVIMGLMLSRGQTAVVEKVVTATVGKQSVAVLPTDTATIKVVSTDTSIPPTHTPILTINTPTPSVIYKVQSGDSLKRIADKFHISVYDLMTTNNLSNEDFIRIDQQLIIPVGRLPTLTPIMNAPTAVLTVTTSSFNGVVITISDVVAPGNLEQEHLSITNLGSRTNLKGWTLGGSPIGTFSFPEIFIFSGDTIHIHTKVGQSTKNDLYLNQIRAAWPSGTVIVLRDNKEKQRTTFTIP